MNIFVAPLTIAIVASRVYGKTQEERNNWRPYAIPSFGLFFLFILFHFLELVVTGCWAIAWFWYVCFICQITAVRIKTRKIHGIDGNASEDFFAALFLYPNVALQLDITTDPCQQEKLRKSGQSNETYKKTECSTEDGSGKICGLH